MKNLIILTLILITSSLDATEIKKFPLGKWPLLAKFEQSKCLDIDDESLDLPITARAQGNTIISKFMLVSYGGKFFVNPEVNKGWKSITFSFESATNQVAESGKSCYQTFEVGLKAWPEKYDKLYIVVDRTVRYEIPIEKSDTRLSSNY